MHERMILLHTKQAGILKLTATPTETALILRTDPSERANDAILPVEKDVNRYSCPLSCIHFTAEQGPDPLLTCSL